MQFVAMRLYPHYDVQGECLFWYSLYLPATSTVAHIIIDWLRLDFCTSRIITGNNPKRKQYLLLSISYTIIFQCQGHFNLSPPALHQANLYNLQELCPSYVL